MLLRVANEEKKMNGLEQAQRIHDARLPQETAEYFRKDELEDARDMYREPVRRGFPPAVSDEQIEQFIVELVASPNKDLFLENRCGFLPRSASNECELHIAVARQWVKDKAAVGETIGPVFWRWARHCAIEAAK
jgi:hypothetical protein